MQVLVLSAAQRLPDLTRFYEALGEVVELDLRLLVKEQQRNLRYVLAGIDLSKYQRVLLDLPFKNIHRQWRVLQRLPGLMIYEEDACQNFIVQSRWYGAFTRFYRRLPGVRVVVTGGLVAERLCWEGISADFLVKGYDPHHLFCSSGERDIELGFIGRTGSSVYSERRNLLEQLSLCEPLQVLRTEPGEPYRKALSRIRYFVSADVGLGEYMAKNFEAMACGCVLLAWRQGDEEQLIGLEDGRHLLLYSTLEELRGHLAALRDDPQYAQQIADAGRAFAESRLTYPHMASRMAGFLREPTAAQVTASRSWLDRIRTFMGCL